MHISKILGIFVSLNNKIKKQNKMENKCDLLSKLNSLEDNFKKDSTELRKKIENLDKCPQLTYKNVTDLDKAEEILKNCCTSEHIKFTENQFCRKKDWISYVLETKIKAVNYLDNDGKIWIKDFTNQNEYYYTPYFYMGDGGFSYRNFDGWNTYSFVGYGWGFKSKDTMLYCVKMWLSDYKFYHTGK